MLLLIYPMNSAIENPAFTTLVTICGIRKRNQSNAAAPLSGKPTLWTGIRFQYLSTLDVAVFNVHGHPNLSFSAGPICLCKPCTVLTLEWSFDSNLSLSRCFRS